jgi:hypothetical protein
MSLPMGDYEIGEAPRQGDGFVGVLRHHGVSFTGSYGCSPPMAGETLSLRAMFAGAGFVWLTLTEGYGYMWP